MIKYNTMYVIQQLTTDSARYRHTAQCALHIEWILFTHSRRHEKCHLMSFAADSQREVEKSKGKKTTILWLTNFGINKRFSRKGPTKCRCECSITAHWQHHSHWNRWNCFENDKYAVDYNEIRCTSIYFWLIDFLFDSFYSTGMLRWRSPILSFLFSFASTTNLCHMHIFSIHIDCFLYARTHQKQKCEEKDFRKSNKKNARSTRTKTKYTNRIQWFLFINFCLNSDGTMLKMLIRWIFWRFRTVLNWLKKKKRKSSFIICCYNTHENRGLVQNYYTILQYGGHF